MKLSHINYYEMFPTNWLKLELKDVLFPMKSKRPQGEYFEYIDIEAIDNRKHQIYNTKLLKCSNAPSRASRKVNKGDILFSTVRPYLENIAIVEEKHENCIASTGFYVCSPYKIIESKFMYYFLLSPYCINYVMPHMKGENSPSIRGSILENMIFAFPSKQEQTRIILMIDKILNFLLE